MILDIIQDIKNKIGTVDTVSEDVGPQFDIRKILKGRTEI